MNRRIAKIISIMKQQACLVTSPSDLFYLTGVQLEGFWLLFRKKGVFALTSRMLKAQLSELLPQFRVLADDDLFELLIKTCKDNKIKKLGVNAKNISYIFGKKLDKSIKITDIGDLIPDQRLKKDETEINSIRISCYIASLAIKYAKKLIKPGMSEIEIYYKIEEFFVRNNVKQAFPTIVATGPNSALPHHVCSNRKILRNDTVLIDLGCIYKGYSSDLTRTFYLGKINKSQKKVFSLVSRAKTLAISSIKHGVRSNLVDKAARDLITQGGYGDRFIHTTGHGLGIEVHEAPRLSSKDKTVLKSGMVVTVEPGIYLKGSFGVRLEDTILVTNKGCEVLTDPKERIKV